VREWQHGVGYIDKSFENSKVKKRVTPKATKEGRPKIDRLLQAEDLPQRFDSEGKNDETRSTDGTAEKDRKYALH
jgi:hypothetical protein